MTRLWKRTTHESILVLTVLILVQTGWTFDESRKLTVEIVIGTTADAKTLRYYLSRWNDSSDAATQDDVTYYGEGLADVFFRSSAENGSLTLTDLSRCLNDFTFETCLKLLLVNRLDNLIDYLNENNLTKTDFGNSVVSFESVPGANDYDGREFAGDEAFGLDEDIARKLMELFKDRSLRVNLLPGVGVDVRPIPATSPGEFVGFKARPYLKWNLWRNDDDAEESEGRSGNKKRKRKGGFKMPPMMIMPQLIMFGLMPFALANLQAMVMNAFMLNMMALNSAIFMTIRNLVFGPRGGPKVKYVNYGYRKKKKSSVPTIIVHSPAAFVKQPFHLVHRHRKPIHHHPHHQHHHHHPPPRFHNHIHEPDTYHEEFPVHHNGVEVIGEEGHLDGKNRVRIRVNEDDGPSVREVLHRIRAIESHDNGFQVSHTGGTGYSESAPSGYDTSSADNTPWSVSDHSASHTFSDTHSERDDYVINYDQNEFTPMITPPNGH